jgi:hypothetical protein
MELDIQQIKSLVLPQHSTSASINQGVVVSPREGNTVNGIEDLDTTPMDIEDGTLQQARVSEIQDFVSSYQ